MVAVEVEVGVVEEGEVREVTGAEDDDVDLRARAVLEVHGGAIEASDVGLGLDVAVADVVDELLVDDGVRLEELVIGLAQAELLEISDREAQDGLEHHPAQGQREPQGEEEVGGLVRRSTEGVLRVVVVAATRGVVGLLGVLRALDGDVAARVARTHDEHALAAHDIGALVVRRVLDVAGEGVLPGILRDLGPPVVPVGDHDPGVLARGRLAGHAIEHRDIPAVARRRSDADDLGVERQVVEQSEVLGVRAEVAVHLPVRRVVRVGVRHGKVGELREGLGRDEVRRLVDAGVLGVEVPVATQVGVALEAVGVEAELEEVLEGGEAMRAGPHHGPGSPAVDDITHDASILGVREGRKPGGAPAGNRRFPGKSGESR